MATTKKDNKLSFVLYDGKDIPKFYKIKKNSIRFALTVFPLISLISLFIIIVGIIYFKEIKFLMVKKESHIITTLKEDNQKLGEKITELRIFTNELQSKLSTTDSNTSYRPLDLIKTTSDQKDLTKAKQISIRNSKDGIEIIPTIDESRVKLQFNLVNNSQTNVKLMGFIYVIMKSKSSLHFYPNNGLLEQEFKIEFKRGEYFSFERLRVVNAIFSKPQKVDNLSFKIILFSRIGDIIHEQVIDYQPPESI